MSKEKITKKVLIICFSYPPNGEIGGRRWSFFGKYLNRNEIEVHVLASDFGGYNLKESPWSNEVKSFESRITRIAHSIPFHILNKNPTSFINKIRYKLSELKAKRHKNCNPYDRSINFGMSAFKAAKKIILKEGITNVVVTGGPFDFLFDIMKLKNEFKSNINLIVDLRDPWTEKYGENLGKDSFKIAERNKNEYVLKIADYIFVPTDGMYAQMSNFWSKYKHKIHIFPHGYDDDLFNSIQFNKGHFSKWYYAGTLYPSVDKEIQLLKSIIEKTNSKLDVYCFQEQNEYNLFSDNRIAFKSIVPQDILLNNTIDFGISLIMLPYDRRNDRTSKFYDLVKAGKFLLYIGPEGATSEFIKDNELGYVIHTDDTDEISDKILEEFQESFKHYKINKSGFIEDYSMQKIVTKMTELFVL